MSELTHKIIGAAIEVHRVLGAGFAEAVYEEALCMELELRGIPFVRQPPVPVHYKGRIVGHGRLDILVENLVIVELKAVDSMIPAYSAQVLSYLKAADKKVGLLINFNSPTLKEGIKRLVRL